MNIQLVSTLLQRLDGRSEAIEVQEPFASGPERCILVFDRSGSMGADDYSPSRLQAAFDSGLEFVKVKLASSPQDLISIVMFEDGADLICRDLPPTEAMKALKYLKDEDAIGGGTDINSGLLEAETLLKEGPPGYRKRILLLTDGHGRDFIRTGQRLRRDGVLIDVIGIAGKPSDVAEEDLKKVASVVNGATRYRFIKNRAELLRHFKTIANDLQQVK